MSIISVLLNAKILLTRYFKKSFLEHLYTTQINNEIVEKREVNNVYDYEFKCLFPTINT